MMKNISDRQFLKGGLRGVCVAPKRWHSMASLTVGGRAGVMSAGVAVGLQQISGCSEGCWLTRVLETERTFSRSQCEPLNSCLVISSSQSDCSDSQRSVFSRPDPHPPSRLFSSGPSCLISLTMSPSCYFEVNPTRILFTDVTNVLPIVSEKNELI